MFPDPNFDPDFNHLPNQPPINIGHVQNFYALDTHLSGHIDLNLNVDTVLTTSKSTRRSVKRKLKKIERQAQRVYDQMLEDDFALVDDHYEVQM